MRCSPTRNQDSRAEPPAENDNQPRLSPAARQLGIRPAQAPWAASRQHTEDSIRGNAGRLTAAAAAARTIWSRTKAQQAMGSLAVEGAIAADLRDCSASAGTRYRRTSVRHGGIYRNSNQYAAIKKRATPLNGPCVSPNPSSWPALNVRGHNSARPSGSPAPASISCGIPPGIDYIWCAGDASGT
jgi:hypothetical protein